MSFSNSAFFIQDFKIRNPDLAAFLTSRAASFMPEARKATIRSLSLKVLILPCNFSIMVLTATRIFSLTPLVLVLDKDNAAAASFDSDQFSQALTRAFSASSAMKALVSAAFFRSMGMTFSRIQSTFLPQFSNMVAKVPRAFLES